MLLFIEEPNHVWREQHARAPQDNFLRLALREKEPELGQVIVVLEVGDLDFQLEALEETHADAVRVADGDAG